MTDDSKRMDAPPIYAHEHTTDSSFFEDHSDVDASLMALENTLAQLDPHSTAQSPQPQEVEVPPAYHNQAPLRSHVEQVVRAYFAALGDEMPTDLYALILQEVEAPLLQVVLEQTRGNQTKCAQVLGLNRGTLRKKLKTYGLME